MQILLPIKQPCDSVRVYQGALDNAVMSGCCEAYLVSLGVLLASAPDSRLRQVVLVKILHLYLNGLY